MAAPFSSRDKHSCKTTGAAVLAVLLLGGCLPLQGVEIPHVEHFRQIPAGVRPDWLRSTKLELEPFASGSVHTPVTLEALPAQFRVRYPRARTYRPLWARERDVAAFLFDALKHSLDGRMRSQSLPIQFAASHTRETIEWYYHASGHLELGAFRPVLFDSNATHLGDASTGNDQFAPFRKAFLIPKQQPTAEATVRIVTGYLGLHCAHELVGRSNTDHASLRIDWLAALVDPKERVVAQAYVGVNSSARGCPVRSDSWDELMDSLVGEFIAAVVAPVTR